MGLTPRLLHIRLAIRTPNMDLSRPSSPIYIVKNGKVVAENRGPSCLQADYWIAGTISERAGVVLWPVFGRGHSTAPGVSGLASIKSFVTLQMMVKEPEGYRYCGHHAYLQDKATEIIDPGKILSMLGGREGGLSTVYSRRRWRRT